MLAVLISIIIFYLVFDLYQRFYKPRVATQTWPELAALTGLTYQSPTWSGANKSLPTMTGNYRDHELKLDLTNASTTVLDDGVARYRTRIVLAINGSINGSVSLKRKGLFGANGEITLDDPPFDKRYIIESQPEEMVHQIFASPQLRERLLGTNFNTLRISDLGLFFDKTGAEQNINTLQSYLELLCDIADTIER